MAATTATLNLTNYIKPEPVFIERYSDIPRAVDKRRLYELSDNAFEEFKLKAKALGKTVLCTDAEVKVMREDVEDTERSLTSESFFFVGDVKCENCERQLNYFDVFKTAVKFHGLEFLKLAILGPTKTINLAPLTKEQVLYCTNCNHVWRSKLEDDIGNEQLGYLSYAGGQAGYGKVGNDQISYLSYAGGQAGYGKVGNEQLGYLSYAGGKAGYGKVSRN